MDAASQSSQAFKNFLDSLEDRDTAKFFEEIHQEFMFNKNRDDDLLRRQVNAGKKYMDDHRDKAQETLTDWALELHYQLKFRIENLPLSRPAVAVDLLEGYIYSEVTRLHRDLAKDKKALAKRTYDFQNDTYNEHRAKLESDEEKLLEVFQKFVKGMEMAKANNLENEE